MLIAMFWEVLPHVAIPTSGILPGYGRGTTNEYSASVMIAYEYGLVLPLCGTLEMVVGYVSYEFSPASSKIIFSRPLAPGTSEVGGKSRYYFSSRGSLSSTLYNRCRGNQSEIQSVKKSQSARRIILARSRCSSTA